MKPRATAYSLPRLVVRLKDPQMQVWIMAGVAVLLVLIGHLRAWSPSGEGKNASQASASKMLLGGAKLEWTEEFGPGKQEARRPTLVLAAPTAPARTALAKRSEKSKSKPALTVNLDVRPVMAEAAGRSWKFLKAPLRQQLAALPNPAAAPVLRLRWSGDARGNGSLVARSRKSGEAEADELAAFVIGNGSRSPDGMIETLFVRTTASPEVLITTAPPTPALRESIEITLIGTALRGPSPRQTAALGELLNQLEAVCGHRLLMETEAAASLPGPALPRSNAAPQNSSAAPDLAKRPMPETDASVSARATARHSAQAQAHAKAPAGTTATSAPPAGRRLPQTARGV